MRRQVYQAPPEVHITSNHVDPEVAAQKAKEETGRRISDFAKLIILSILFILAAFFFGLSSKFVFTNPFFFVSWDRASVLNITLFTVSLLILIAVFSLMIIGTHDSFVEFVPGWLLATVAFFIGIGSFTTPGWVLAGGFLVSCLVYFLFAQSDIEDSFTFSVRHAFSSMSIFLTLLFAVFSAAYYFAASDILSRASDLPDETIQPIYDFQIDLWSKRLGVPEDQVEEELQKIEEEGATIDVFGIFETDVDFDAAHPYSWFKESFSKWISPVMRWITLGLAVSLFLTISVFIAPLNLIAKAIIWLFVEALVAVGVFRKSVETREATVVGI